MRNYFFSVTVHVILLLLLLGLSSVTIKKEREEKIHAIMVDFSQEEEQDQTENAREMQKTPVKTKSKEVNAPKSVKTPDLKAKHVKTFEKKTLHTSQKPRVESTKVLAEESTVVKKVIPPSKPAPTPEEIAEKEREKEIQSKRAQFDALLSKAKKKTAADQNQPERREEVSGETTGTSPNISSKNKNIQGVLGNRRVLKIPTIQDKSQKKGRVVVKICVDGSGKVMSSKYTMMGSTTNDTYLIQLAEKGAMGYLFSTSENPRECGNVIIDFKLK